MTYPVTESRLGLRGRTVEEVSEVRLLAHHTHAAAAATHGCLEDDREAILLDKLLNQSQVLDSVLRTCVCPLPSVMIRC